MGSTFRLSSTVRSFWWRNTELNGDETEIGKNFDGTGNDVRSERYWVGTFKGQEILTDGRHERRRIWLDEWWRTNQALGPGTTGQCRGGVSDSQMSRGSETFGGVVKSDPFNSHHRSV